MTPHINDPAVEHATRIFLLGMARMNARRTPDRPNRVPDFDSLNAIDRTMLLSVIGHTIKAAKDFKVEAPANTGSDTERTPAELVS